MKFTVRLSYLEICMEVIVHGVLSDAISRRSSTLLAPWQARAATMQAAVGGPGKF